MPIKAIFKSGLWVITAVVRGEVQEYAGKQLRQAIALLERDRAKEFIA